MIVCRELPVGYLKARHYESALIEDSSKIWWIGSEDREPGYIQSHWSNTFKCGHCAGGHPTWECPSQKGQAIPVKCTNCSEGYHPTSRGCSVKTAAMNEAERALTDGLTYHCVPQHFRAAKGMAWRDRFMSRTSREMKAPTRQPGY